MRSAKIKQTSPSFLYVDGKESFSFSVSNGDTFRITSPVGEVLGRAAERV